ncbi:hypothetical protein SNEBB_006252 [Seison nebaliae]|nr:hypothetical protein SNEBB_006252 [Seison nebaliae]
MKLLLAICSCLVALSYGLPQRKDCGVTMCTLEYAPVCASNHNTYGNMCALEAAQCYDKTIKKLHDGNCKIKDFSTPKPTCHIHTCSTVSHPVCGTDGETYFNNCMLHNSACVDSSLKKAHPGKC